MAFGLIPRGWAQCNGQLLSIQQNQALFSVIGIAYGGDGRSTFGLPNLQARVPLGFTNAYILGSAGGEATHALTVGEMPPHSHPVACLGAPGGASVAAGSFWAGTKSAGGLPFDKLYTDTPTTTLAADALANAGGGVGHENLQPYLVLNFCIALIGIFPSRG